MFFEIEMFEGYIDGLINLLNTVENKDNVTLDFCFNTSEHLEQIDTNKTSEDELKDRFAKQVARLQHKYKQMRIYIKYHDSDTGFYYHADYRRDLNYNYCIGEDYVMWGETDSFFPAQALEAIETLAKFTDEQNEHRYILSFADRKMWDDSWDVLVHPEYESFEYDHNSETHHTNPNQAKSCMSIKDMNEVNSKSEHFEFQYINYPKISGACLVLSADLIKSGVNVPSCLIYNDDEGLSVMGQKLMGTFFKQYICKNILHVHARRHPQKRMYVKGEDNPHSFAPDKNDNFHKFKKMSQANIQSLIEGKNKFYEYGDII